MVAKRPDVRILWLRVYAKVLKYAYICVMPAGEYESHPTNRANMVSQKVVPYPCTSSKSEWFSRRCLHFNGRDTSQDSTWQHFMKQNPEGKDVGRKTIFASQGWCCRTSVARRFRATVYHWINGTQRCTMRWSEYPWQKSTGERGGHRAVPFPWSSQLHISYTPWLRIME